MSPRLFASLDAEWQTLATSTKLAPRACWAEDEILGGFATLGDLRAVLRASRDDHEAADQILAALACRASHDDLAARTLLQALLPGLVNVAKRLGCGVVNDELEADVLTEAIARIRMYPIERRPARIAANITWDVFGRLARRRRQGLHIRVEPVDHLDTGVNESSADPSVEVYELVRDAVETGALRLADARLLLDIAVGHDTITERACREGIAYAAMNERWRRARNRLRLAVAA